MNTLVLDINESEKLDDVVMATWLDRLKTEAPPESKVVIDLSRVAKLSEREVRLITRHIASKAKDQEWNLVILCSKDDENVFEKLGVNKLFKFYNVHAKSSPVENLFPESTNGGSPVRAEISVFFGYLAASIFNVSESMLENRFSYCPPMRVEASAIMEVGRVENPVIIRMQSDALVYRVFILIKKAHIEKLASIIFQGREVSEAAVKDLLPEISNSIMGDLSSQLSRLKNKISLKYEIPTFIPESKVLPNSDLDMMKGIACMQFLSGDVEMKVVVGYSVKI